MDTRILKMCRRSEIKADKSRLVEGLGQLQPVLFCRSRDGRLTFRAEDIAERFGEMRSCISVLDFRYHKAEIRRLFTELEHHKAEGTETPAAKSWRLYQEAQAEKLKAPAAPLPPSPKASVEFDLFGEPR